MAMTVSELQVKVSADTSAAESGLSKLAGHIQQGFGMGAGIKAFDAAWDGLKATVTGSVSKFAEFEAQMNILKVTTGATDAQMAAMGQHARALGADLDLPATSSAGAATAMLELAKAGLDVDQAMMATKGALQLAAAASIDEANAAQLTAGALNSFGLRGDKATLVANQLAYAANASALDATDLGQAVAQAGFIFKATGRPMEELLSSMIVLGNAGLSGSDGATALKNALMQASSPTDKAAKTMREYGISLFDAQGQMKAVPTIIDHLNARLGHLTQEERNAALATIFMSDGMKALIPMMAAGGDKLREYESNLKTTNAASEQAEARSAGLTGALKGLGSQWETLQETVGSKVAPAVERAIRSIAEGIGAMAGAAAEADFSGLSNAIDSAVTTSKEAIRQLGDAFRTVKQVFGEGWEPDASIEPLALAAGNAATKLKELRDTIGEATDKARQMGAWDDVKAGFSNLADAAKIASDRLDDITAALNRARGPSSDAASTSDRLANALKGAALGWQYATLMVEGFVDTLGSSIAVAIDYTTGLSRIGTALQQLQRGDFPGAWQSLREANALFASGETAAEAFRVRGLERTGQSAEIMSRLLDLHMGRAVGAVEVNMSAATAAVSDGSSGMQQFMEANISSMAGSTETGMATVAGAVETGMAEAVGAVEAQGPAAVAAAETMGTGMAAGIETSAPAMAAAAESGATSAVAAVQGQSGAASAAGSSVGASIGQGLLDGISSYVGSVAAKAYEIVQTAIGAGNVAADAHSPSKKTEQLGKDMAEGLEIGLSSSKLGEEMQAKIRAFIDATREYIPVASHIASIEAEIKATREKAQTEALFRAQEMIDLDSETLRLKEAAVRLDRDALSLRHDLAAASREIADAERGSLADRTRTIEMDGQRKALRLETLKLEQQLVGLDRDSKRARSIQEQIDKLRDQDRLLAIESERIKLTNEISATGARVRREELDDRVRGYDTVIDAIKQQIETLDAEKNVFQANEAVIKNATDNEVAYRERLIAVFKSESAPLRDRISAGLALVDQLEREGAISKELADKLRATAKEAGAASGSTNALATSAGEAAPKLDAAASKADRLASEAAEIAKQSAEASRKVDALSSSLGKLPSWFKATGSSNGLFKFADGGRPPVGVPSLVGERGPELFVPDRSGTIIPADVTQSWMGSGGGHGGGSAPQSIRLDIAVGGKVAKQIVIDGYELAVRGGWTPGGLTG